MEKDNFSFITYLDSLTHEECLELRKILKSTVNTITARIKRQQCKDWNKLAMAPCQVCGKSKTPYNPHKRCQKALINTVISHDGFEVDLS